MEILPFQRLNLRILLLGILLGICVSFFVQYLLLTNNYLHEIGNSVDWHSPCQMNENLNSIFSRNNFDSSKPTSEDDLHAGENELANALFERIRILCFVMTQPSNYESKTIHVIATWAKRCNVLYFVSTQKVYNYSTVIYNGTESRDILWGKTKIGFKYAYEKHFDDADWFVKADDDTFMVLENLRYMLLDKNPADPVHYGCKYKPYVAQGYMSGGSGYVLSKEALRRFVEESLPNGTRCKQDDSGAEDVEIGICLQNVGVEAGDSRDREEKLRFFPFVPHDHVPPGKIDPEYWYWKNIWYTHEQGIECCSDSVISFHYVEGYVPYLMDYLIYHVHPFGIHPQLTGSAVKDQIIQYLIQLPATNISKTITLSAIDLESTIKDDLIVF